MGHPNFVSPPTPSPMLWATGLEQPPVLALTISSAWIPCIGAPAWVSLREAPSLFPLPQASPQACSNESQHFL